MRRFEAFPSRLKIAGLLLLNLCMVAVAAFCTTLPAITAKIAGWAGVLFFGLGFVVLPRAFFLAKTPKIVIDDSGIHTGSSIGLVEWGDITGFRVDSIKGTKFLSVLVVDADKYLQRMSATARMSAQTHPHLGVSEIALCFVGLSPGLADACFHLAELGYHVENG
jgi:hypothetical protein